jgi:uncharacterized repeat protein (TIGR04076 family)
MIEPQSVARLTAPAARLRVVVDRAVDPRCGLRVGDGVVIDGPTIATNGREFCSAALAAVAPLLAARQYALPVDDWLVRKPYVSCPRAEDRVVLRIEEIGEDGP